MQQDSRDSRWFTCNMSQIARVPSAFTVSISSDPIKGGRVAASDATLFRAALGFHSQYSIRPLRTFIRDPSAAGTIITRGYRFLGSHFAKMERSPVSATIYAFPSPGLENIRDFKHIWLRLPCMDCLLPIIPPDIRVDIIQGTKSISSLPSWDSGINNIYRSWRKSTSDVFKSGHTTNT
jgi:hypothetical protein